jgi:hypothetical protein
VALLPTPETAWGQRHVNAAQHRYLQATVNRYRQEELVQRGIPGEPLLSDAAQASVAKNNVRTLTEHGMPVANGGRRRPLAGRGCGGAIDPG